MSVEPITEKIPVQSTTVESAVAAEKGLLIAVLLLVVLGVGAMLFMQ
jgi:hypothetical protein